MKDAVLVKTPSTVAAVEALLNDEEEGRSSAAIASGVCERLFDGVQVLFKGVQDEACESGFLYIRVSRSFFLNGERGLPSFDVTANFTRFYILARSIDEELPSASEPCCPWSHSISQNKGLVRIREPQNYGPSFGPAYSWFGYGMRGGGLANLLSALDLPICRLDRRPVLGAKTFEHVYIVEVDDDDQSPSSINSSPIIPDSAMVEGIETYGWGAAELHPNKPFLGLENDGVWGLRLRQAVGRVLEAGGDAEVLGCW